MLWAREIVYFGQSIQIYIRVSALKYFQNQILIKCFVDCFSSKISTSIVSVQQKRQKLCFDTAIIKIWFPWCTEHLIVPFNSENCKMSNSVSDIPKNSYFSIWIENEHFVKNIDILWFCEGNPSCQRWWIFEWKAQYKGCVIDTCSDYNYTIVTITIIFV